MITSPFPLTPTRRWLPCSLKWPLALATIFTLFGSAQAAKVLYIQDSGLRDSAKMANILVDQGHDVTILDLEGGDTVDTASNYAAAGYQLLVVDEVVGSGNVGNNLANSPVPVVSSEAFLYRNPRTFFNSVTGGGTSYETVGAAVGANAPYGQIRGETAINITNPSHPLAAGLGAGNVDIFDTTVDRNIFVVPQEGTGRPDGVITFISTSGAIAGITKVAEVPGGTVLASVFCVEPGEILSDGSTNQARWVHLPWNSSQDARVLQEPAFFLYEAAVAYALGLPEPTKIRDLTEPTVFADTNTVIAFSVDKTTAGASAVATNDIALSVNGIDVSGDLVISDGGTTWDVTYSTGFAADEVYTVVASATAADGGTSARRTTLDTLDPMDFSVEAEDYNYTSNSVSGLFFDNPIFCTTIGGGVDGCYYDRLSEAGIDRFKGTIIFTPNPDVPFNIETYRWSDDPVGSFRLEFMDTYVSFDWAMLARTNRFPDYEVRNIVQNDWQNYTRTYPTGTYHIYLRMLSSATNGTVQLDLVDEPTTNAPNLIKVGRFLSDGIGPQTVPLTDDGGNAKIVVEFTNTTATTMRLTQLSAGLYMQGYFVLVPTEAAVNEPPVVTITAPADGLTVFEGQATTIEVTATDDGTITNVQFKANGALFAEDDTAPYTADFIPPALGALLTEYTIQAVASDDGGLTGSDSIGLKAVDPSYTFVNTAVGNGSDVEMREQNVPGDQGRNSDDLNTRFKGSDRNDVTGLRFDLTGYDLSTVNDVALNLTNYRNNNASRRVDVYGVTQGAAGGSGLFTTETWSDTTVTNWGDLPGLLTSDGDVATMSIDTNNLTLLVDNFAIVNLNEGTLETLSSPALTSFVQNFAGSSSITFLLVAGNLDSGQFRFASKEATALDGGDPVGAAGDFAPFLAFRVPSVTIDIDSFSVSGNQATLTWSGGTGPYTVQTNSPITGTWGNEQSGIAGTSATVNATSEEGYYRVAE